MVAFVPGVALAFALDHRLRPSDERSPARSLVLAFAVAGLTWCAISGVIFIPLVGIAFGVLTGACTSAAVGRMRAAPTAAT